MRIPAKVLQEMGDRGWVQWGHVGDKLDTWRDPVRMRLIELMNGPRNADRSVTVKNPSEAMLARLWYEGDSMADSYRFGDQDMDSLGEYNSGMAMCRKVEALLGRGLTYPQAVAMMSTEERPGCAHGAFTPAKCGCYECGVGDLDSSG